MIRTYALGWQTTMLDLTLILFLVTAAALTEAPSSDAVPHQPPTLAALDNASAVYRPGAGVPPLAQWLDEQAPDARQRLTILAVYPSGQEAEAARRAVALLAQAHGHAPQARIVLEPGGESQLLALIGYDRQPEEMARALLDPAQDTFNQGTRP